MLVGLETEGKMQGEKILGERIGIGWDFLGGGERRKGYWHRNWEEKRGRQHWLGCKNKNINK